MIGSEFYAYADRQNRIEKERLDVFIKHLSKELDLKVHNYKLETDRIVQDYKKCLITSGNMVPPHKSPPLSVIVKKIMDDTTDNQSKIKKSGGSARPRNLTSSKREEHQDQQQNDDDLVDHIFNDDELSDDEMDEHDQRVLNYADDKPSLQTHAFDIRRSSSVPLTKLKERQQLTSSASPEHINLRKSSSYLKMNTPALKLLNEFEISNRKLKAHQERRASALLSEQNLANQPSQSPLNNSRNQKSKTYLPVIGQKPPQAIQSAKPNLQTRSNQNFNLPKPKRTQTSKPISTQNQQQKDNSVGGSHTRSLNLLQGLKDNPKRFDQRIWQLRQAEIKRRNDAYLRDLNERVKLFVKTVKLL